MNIKKLLLIIISLCIVLIFDSCSSKSTDEPLGICHFGAAEVAIPKEFIGTGNTTMFFTSEEHEGIFLIIGETSDYEEDVAKNLALFESTKFFKNKIKFTYIKNEEAEFSGVLCNERLDNEYYFEGRKALEFDFYIFCMCENDEDKDYIKELVDNVFSSIDENKE